MEITQPEFLTQDSEPKPVRPDGHDEKTVVLKGNPMIKRPFIPGQKCETCGSLEPCPCTMPTDRFGTGVPVFMKGKVHDSSPMDMTDDQIMDELKTLADQDPIEAHVSKFNREHAVVGPPVHLRTEREKRLEPVDTPEERERRLAEHKDPVAAANIKSLLENPSVPETLTGDTTTQKHINIWGQTVSGAKYFPADIAKSDFTVQDVIAALSKICRFCGHIKEFYSVAQHSVYVALRVRQILTSEVPIGEILTSHSASRNPNELRQTIYAMTLWALFHDGSEAFFQDMPAPTKMVLTGNYVELSDLSQIHILKMLGFRLSRDGAVWFYGDPQRCFSFNAKLMKKVCKRADIEVLCSESAVLVNKAGQEWASDKTHGPVKGLEVIPMLPRQAQGRMTELWQELVNQIESPVSQLH